MKILAYKSIILCLFALCINKQAFCQSDKKIDRDDFVENAILEGLRNDKFPLQTAELILDNPVMFFVPKCPICTPVQNALREYVKVKTKSKKSKTPKTILDGFASNDKTTKQIALRDLVELYTEAAFQKLTISSAELEGLKNDLAAGRKQGMSNKNSSFGEFCPSCDGTCKKK